MGRPNKPGEVKDATGNPGRRAYARTPETLPGLGDQAPAHLKGRKPRAAWERVAETMSHLRFLRATDREAMARYCQHLVDWWDLTDAIRKEGRTYWSESQHGKLQRINPKFIVRDRVEGRMIDLEDRLGLNPRSRQQILQALAAGIPAGQPELPLSGEPVPPSSPESPIGALNTGSVH